MVAVPRRDPVRISTCRRRRSGSAGEPWERPGAEGGLGDRRRGEAEEDRQRRERGGEDPEEAAREGSHGWDLAGVLPERCRPRPHSLIRRQRDGALPGLVTGCAHD